MFMVAVGDQGELALSEDPTGGSRVDGSPCGQFQHNQKDVKWYGAQLPAAWRFNESSIPNGNNVANVVAAARDAMQNTTNQNNSCGLLDQFGSDGNYLGDTDRVAQTDPDGNCSQGNGYSTVNFGTLTIVGTIAKTCIFGFYDDGGGKAHVNEVDIRLDDSRDWTTTPGVSDCHAWDIENTLTHEFGHWWGLQHVNGSDLTMFGEASKCEVKKRSLGYGDVLGFREQG